MLVNTLYVFQSLFSLSLLVTNPLLIYLKTTSWNSIWYHRLCSLPASHSLVWFSSYLSGFFLLNLPCHPLKWKCSLQQSYVSFWLTSNYISLTSMSPRSIFSTWTYLLSSCLSLLENLLKELVECLKGSDFKLSSSTISCLKLLLF